MQRIRFWGDEPNPYSQEIVRELESVLDRNPRFTERLDLLAISGGAEDGAYGAGFLNGWTDRGDRPEFELVTGISTGALIAPFAFLGPAYDDALERLFTGTSTEDVFFLTPFEVLFGGAAVGDTQPLRQRIAREVNEALIDAIAQESRKGRTLQIGTTDLDAQRPVIWDIGRIAEYGGLRAVELIRKIMLASASIPGVFPPVLIDVWIDGERHQEVHVDGGVTTQVFLYPSGLKNPRLEQLLDLFSEKHAWLIRNAKSDPEYEPVELSLGDIVTRSITTLLKYQGKGNVLNIAAAAERDGFDFNFTSVPAEFDVPSKDMFDPQYMRSLYEVGYEQALSGEAWLKVSEGTLVRLPATNR